MRDTLPMNLWPQFSKLVFKNFIFIDACVHVCLCVCIHVYLCTCVCVHACVPMCVCALMCPVCLCVCTCVLCAHMHKCKWLQARRGVSGPLELELQDVSHWSLALGTELSSSKEQPALLSLWSHPGFLDKCNFTGGNSVQWGNFPWTMYLYLNYWWLSKIQTVMTVGLEGTMGLQKHTHLW